MSTQSSDEKLIAVLQSAKAPTDKQRSRLLAFLKRTYGQEPELTWQQDDSLKLIIEDDGCGLPPGSGQQGFGLAGMRERVKALGGTLNLSCTHGTRVSVSLPLRSYYV